MRFIEFIAAYVLGNVSRTRLPEIAISAIEENIESESTIILAGMTSMDNTYELEQYFNSALTELRIELPDKLLAAKILIRYYLNGMISNRKDAFNLMGGINDVYNKFDWKIESTSDEKTIVGIELGLEHLYTWYRELQDYYDGGMLLYYNELPEREQLDKFEQHLIEEAITLNRKLEIELTAYYNENSIQGREWIP